MKKKELVPRATSAHPPTAAAAVPPSTLALRGSVVAGGKLALRAEPHISLNKAYSLGKDGLTMRAKIEGIEGIEAQTDERTVYSDVDIASALAVLQANSGNVLRTARELNIPRTTLVRWANGSNRAAALTHLRQQKTGELANMWEGALEWVLEEITPSDIASASLKDKGIFAGIATEKRQLLRGEATSIQGKTNADQALVLVDRILAAAQARGEIVTREQVIAKVIERKPELSQHLLPPT